jgi:hypothetical protein
MRFPFGLSTVWILAFAAVTPWSQDEAQDLTLPNIFHIAGIPELRRNARGDLTLTQKTLIFQQGKKVLLELPYQRIRRVQIISAHRDGESTAAAGLLILEKRKVGTGAITIGVARCLKKGTPVNDGNRPLRNNGEGLARPLPTDC